MAVENAPDEKVVCISSSFNSWSDFIDKPTTLIIDDKGRFPVKKTGILRNVDETHFFLEINGSVVAILRSSVLRVEPNGGAKDG